LPFVVAIRWITAFLDFPAADFEAARAFWQAVTSSEISAPRGPGGEFSTLLPAHGDAFLRIQRVRGGPGGCHLDLHVDDASQGAHRAGELGATVVTATEGLIVMASPGGLNFCFVGYGGEVSRPRPACWTAGQRSLTDQLSLDIPPARYEAECAFWSGLTGWRRVTGSRPEFEFLERPAGLPLRLLLQRLDSAASRACSAHLDLACDDVAAERARHEALGAGFVREMPDWTTLRDPAGLSYCITRRDPGTGRLPVAR
jgi:hypothetical protein